MNINIHIKIISISFSFSHNRILNVLFQILFNLPTRLLNFRILIKLPFKFLFQTKTAWTIFQQKKNFQNFRSMTRPLNFTSAEIRSVQCYCSLNALGSSTFITRLPSNQVGYWQIRKLVGHMEGPLGSNKHHLLAI